MRFLIFRPVSRARCARAGMWEEAMSKWQLFWAMVALATAPLFAETTTTTASYPFRYSTLDRSGALSLRPTSEATGLSFKLNAETFDKAIQLETDQLETEWRPVAFVPPKVTVTAISVAIPGSDAPASLTVTPNVAEGETESVRFDLDDDAATETVSLVGTDGIAHTATLRIYKNTTGVTLTPDKACAFRFDDAQTGTAIRNFYTIDGDPHLRVVGTASITRHVITIDDGEQHSFNTLLEEQTTGYQNEANHVIVVEFSGNGGTFNMDSDITASPLVIGSSVSADKAFVNASKKLSSPLSLRDGAEDPGGITLTLPQYHQGDDHFFGPSALLLDCDLTLKSLVPLIEESWLTTHDVPIPAGRTFRLELSEADFATAIADEKSESLLPSLSFADATSRLELATQSTAVAENPLGIPAKYQKMLNTQSGTLVLDRDVTAPQFMLSDWRAADKLPVDGPLETHLILCDGHTYTFSGTLGFSELGGKLGTATLTIEGGTVEVGSLNLTATNTTLDIQGGIVTADGLTGFNDDTLARVTVAQGATLALNGELRAGTTTGILDLTVAGTLELGGDLHMTPAARRTLRVEDGTIHATSAVKIACADGGTSTAEDYLTVSGGGTFSGPLTVDSVTGNGTLTLDSGATVSTLYAYNGTIDGTGMIGTFTGDLGDVTLGGDWLTGAGKTLTDVVDKAQNYHGTLGFTAGTADAPKVIDFASVAKLTELPGAFRVANYQHVTMRLDQYIDATVRWPSPATGVTLTLIESGAYGGEAEIPAVPAGVTFAFQYYDEAGELKKRPETDYQREPSEDGVSDELTWENAVFTGQGAWIDVEFDGTSANTGWFSLGEQNKNGCLVGVEGQPDYGAVTANDRFFTPMGHPVSKGMTLGYRPYVAESALPSFPEEWSLAVRMTAPSSANKCILAIGNNYANATASTYSLVFATGAVEEDGTTEIVLWKFDGYADGAAKPAQDLPAKAIHELFRVKVADAQSAPHVFSVVCDGATLNLYMDGAWLNAINVPAQTTLSGGLQLGQQLGGSRVSASARSLADDVAVADGGAVDYIRFYKGAFPETAMVEMADRTPYVRENLRYVRYVPAATIPEGGETWIQDDAWVEQTYVDGAWVDGETVDQPAEGAECRILVAADEYTLQVNVERQVTGETDGDGQAVPAEHYFYSPNRTYAALVVEPQSGNAAAGTLRLVPYGVTEPESGDTMDARPWETQLTSSAWFTTPEESSPGNRTGFRYGTLRFTGGANDPINDEGRIPNFYGAGYLLSGGATSASGEGTVIEKGEIVQDGGVQYDGGTYYYRYRQEVKVRYATTGAIPMVGIYDAGVCYLSRHANTVLAASADQIQTVEREWRQPLVYENGTYTANGERYIHRTTLLSTSDDTTVGAQLNTLEMVAGMSLTRGVMDEVARWQLTGPVVVQGTTEAGRDYVLGHAGLPKDWGGLHVEVLRRHPRRGRHGQRQRRAHRPLRPRRADPRPPLPRLYRHERPDEV